MSAFTDLLSGVRNVILLEQNVTQLRTELTGVADDVRRMRDYVDQIDRRVVRIETMIELSGRGTQPPRIEG